MSLTLILVELQSHVNHLEPCHMTTMYFPFVFTVFLLIYIHIILGTRYAYLIHTYTHYIMPFLIDTGFVLKSVSSSVTYNQSVLNCISNGKRLCNSKEICIDGNTPVSGAISGDHWVPINDDSNEWIQIGMKII